MYFKGRFSSNMYLMVSLNFLGFFYFILGQFLFFLNLGLKDSFFSPSLYYVSYLGDFFSSSIFSFFLLFDFYSLIYLFVLCFIVSSIHFFCILYMSSDLNLSRFIFILKSFVFSMILLVFSRNFLLFLVG